MRAEFPSCERCLFKLRNKVYLSNRGKPEGKGGYYIKRVTVHPIRTEYGRDALSDTFGECVVAKANEADCGAQTPKSKHREEGGKLHFIICFRNAGVSGKRGGYSI